MARITVLEEGVSLSSPWMVEGFPGLGLVGKIAADHLVDVFDMAHYANVHCDGIPRVATYSSGSRTLSTPVRLYADEGRNLLALQSDVPIAPQAAIQFGNCVSGWFAESGVTPLYLSGRPRKKSTEVPSLYGVGVGGGIERLAKTGIEEPSETGLVSGPTGALLAHAVEHNQSAVGLVVETNPQFPDPEAARVLIKRGIEPLTGIDVPVDALVERAEDIKKARERLAERMHDADEESSRARPIRMYQ
ncbi:proteasome assembly chaperone family protein [Haloferacaceae archaeon DSL9]